MMPNEEEKLDTEEIKQEENKNKKKDKIQELEDEIEKLKADLAHYKNEYYRAYADTKNLRNNLEKEHKEAIKYRVEGFVGELLPILDSFQSVLGKEVEDPNLKNYLVGFSYIYRNLVGVLENEGIKEIAPKVGDEFDDKCMNAVDSVQDENNINKVTKIYGLGYKLHDHLIRPVMVQVGVKEVKQEKDKDNNLEA